MRTGALLSLPLLLAAAAIAGTGSSVRAGEKPAPDWFLQDNTWKSRSLSLGALLYIRIDGRSFVPVTRVGGGPGGAPTGKPPGENELVAVYEGKPVSLRREMKFDPKRQGIRILDVLSNASDEDRGVQVDYFTSLAERGGVRQNGAVFPGGEAREFGGGVPEGAVGAVLLVERPESDAVPLILWGQRDSRWPAAVVEFGSTVRLGYQGTIPRGGRVALLHWVATAGLEKGVRLEQTFERFFKDGRLVDPMLPPEIVPLVGNFNAGAFRPPERPNPDAGTGEPLVALEDLCRRLGVSRGKTDILWMSRDATLSGDAAAGRVSLDSRGAEVAIAFDQVAAVRGGGGRGREHRLFLRDGSVLAGRVALHGGKLVGGFGTATLDADAIELLVLRARPGDGRRPREARGFVEWHDGEMRWLGSEGAGEVELLTVFGAIKVSPDALLLVERRREPPFDFNVLLRDGSSFRGVAAGGALHLDLVGAPGLSASPSVLSRWGAVEALREGGAGGRGGEGAGAWCRLRDGSRLVGRPGGGELRLAAAAGEFKARLAEVVRLTRKPGGGDAVVVELAGGGKLEGRLLTEIVPWKMGGRSVNLPAGLVLEFAGGNGR